MVHWQGLFELWLNVQHTSLLARAACNWGKDISIFCLPEGLWALPYANTQRLHFFFETSSFLQWNISMMIVYTPILGCWEHGLCYASLWRLQILPLLRSRKTKVTSVQICQVLFYNVCQCQATALQLRKGEILLQFSDSFCFEASLLLQS